MAVNSNWEKRQAISIDVSGLSLGGDVSNFPYLLTEDAFNSTVFDDAKSDGADLRFTTDEAGTNEIPFEIADWDNVADEAQVWVKVSTVDVSASFNIYVWYKNSGASAYGRTATYGSDNVWTGYALVMHEESDFSDSSPNAYDLTNNGASAAAGKIDSGMDFEETESDYASIADASAPNLEISGPQVWMAWVKRETVDTGDMIFSKDNSSVKHFFISNVNKVNFRLDGLTTNSNITTTNTIPVATWKHIAGRYTLTGTEISIWLDGVNDTNATASGSATDSNGIMYHGRNPGGNYFDGVMDEVRVFDGELSDDYMKLNYNTQNSPATYLTSNTPVSTSTPANAERSAKTTGEDTSADSRSGKVTGKVLVNNERPSKTTGIDTTNSERSSVVAGDIKKIAFPFQRKSWIDNGNFWRAIYNPTASRIEFWYATDPEGSWTENTTARISDAGVSHDFFVRQTATDVYIAYSDGQDILIRSNSGTYPGTAFGWNAANTVIAGGANDKYLYPNLSILRSNRWIVSATHHDTNTADYYYIDTIRATNPNSISAWDSPISHGDVTNTDPYTFSAVERLGTASEDIFLAFTEGTNYQYELKLSGSWVGTPVSIATILNNQGSHAFSIDNFTTTGAIHMLYIRSDGAVIERNFTSSVLSAEEVLDTNPMARYPVMAEHSDGNAHFFWICGTDIYQHEAGDVGNTIVVSGVSEYAAWLIVNQNSNFESLFLTWQEVGTLVSAFIEGAVASERAAKVTGIAGDNDTRDGKLTGTDTASDTRASKTTGILAANDTRSAKVTGKDTSASSRSAKLTGGIIVNDERSAKLTGAIAINDERSAKVTGQVAATSERSAKVTGGTGVNDERSAKITGTITYTNKYEVRDSEYSNKYIVRNTVYTALKYS